nr:hypothetical protein [Streptomyces sp. Ag109_O5-1]
MDEHQQIAVVLGATGRRGHEDRLGERRGPAERADLLGPAVEIVLDQPVGERVVRELLEFKGAGEGLDQIGGGRRVAVAVRQRDQPVVDPGELLRSVVEALHSGLPRGRVEGVAVQGGRAVAFDGAGGFGHHPRVGDHVQNHALPVVVGVQRVEDPYGIHIDPPHVGRDSRPRHHPYAGLVRVVPLVGNRRAAQGGLAAEGDRQVVDEDVVLGQGEVVHHRA